MSDTVHALCVDYRHDDDLCAMRLRTPVLLARVHHSAADGAWFATDDRTPEFGIGETWQEAVSSYVENLHAMAHWFQTNDLPLGCMMRRRYQAFQQLFRDL